MSIHQEVVVNANPARVYEVLMTASLFSRMTGGAPAEIVATPGAAFSKFGGMILGRQLELQAGQRIVQAWRAKTWEEGAWSIVRFELRAEGSGTRIVFDHLAYPEGQRDHLAAGWEQNYWAPLRKLLAEG
jgi:activator of HSP90 ATPase